jgi:hypothetical protein
MTKNNLQEGFRVQYEAWIDVLLQNIEKIQMLN